MCIHLSTIKILFRAPHGQLWGIPYEMRRDVGQAPRHLWQAASKRLDAMSDPDRYRGCGPLGPYVPPDPVKDWILIDENDPDNRAWLSALDDVPTGSYEWCACRLAMDDVLNTNRRHDKLATIAHQPGDIVRVLFGYRGNGCYAPDGDEGLYIVKSRIARSDDYKLIRWNVTTPSDHPTQQIQMAELLPWDLIAHASRLVRHYWEAE